MKKRLNQMTERELLEVIADQANKSREHIATLKWLALIYFVATLLGGFISVASAL